jgi:hypothetical protein
MTGGPDPLISHMKIHSQSAEMTVFSAGPKQTFIISFSEGLANALRSLQDKVSQIYSPYEVVNFYQRYDVEYSLGPLDMHLLPRGSAHWGSAPMVRCTPDLLQRNHL